MMADTNEILATIQRAKAELLAALEPEALRAGADAAALIENRIVDKGEKADGSALTPYSTKPAPAFYYFGRSRTNAGEKAVQKKAKAKQPISYREFREINGLNTDHKSLEFTGEMWQGFGVIGAKTLSEGVVEVTIGGKNDRTRSLLGYHSDRENTEITAPNREEIQTVSAGVIARLKAIVEKLST
jgi:hypothetical protein